MVPDPDWFEGVSLKHPVKRPADEIVSTAHFRYISANRSLCPCGPSYRGLFRQLGQRRPRESCRRDHLQDSQEPNRHHRRRDKGSVRPWTKRSGRKKTEIKRVERTILTKSSGGWEREGGGTGLGEALCKQTGCCMRGEDGKGKEGTEQRGEEQRRVADRLRRRGMAVRVMGTRRRLGASIRFLFMALRVSFHRECSSSASWHKERAQWAILHCSGRSMDPSLTREFVDLAWRSLRFSEVLVRSSTPISRVGCGGGTTTAGAALPRNVSPSWRPLHCSSFALAYQCVSGSFPNVFRPTGREAVGQR